MLKEHILPLTNYQFNRNDYLLLKIYNINYTVGDTIKGKLHQNIEDHKIVDIRLTSTFELKKNYDLNKS